MEVWDWARGTLVSRLGGHQGWVQDLAFDRRGTRLVSGDTSGVVRLWDTRPDAELLPARRNARRLRDEATPLVEARYGASDGNLDQVIASLDADRELDGALREAALRVAHARFGTRDDLKRWMWRVLGPPDGVRTAQESALGVASGFVRATEFRLLEDAEGYLLAGLARLRLATSSADLPYARELLERAVAIGSGDEPVVASALACLVLSRADAPGAPAARARLDAFVAAHARARDDRVERLLREVEALEARTPSPR